MTKKKLIKFLAFAAVLSFFVAAYGNSTSEENSARNSYYSDGKFSKQTGVYSVLDDASDWIFQYPSGTEEDGMLQTKITENFKSKYFSFYNAENGNKYMRFSLNAGDKGKSKNGSSVRAELRNLNEWDFSKRAELSYSFFLTSTDFAKLKFTVGQFLQHCEKKDSPLCRIEIENGKITAKVVNYKSDGITKADGKSHSYELGAIGQNQEVSIRISVDGKKLSLFRGGELKAVHIFSDDVSVSRKNYFKAGIYYQNKDSPDIFSEIFMRNLKVSVE